MNLELKKLTQMTLTHLNSFFRLGTIRIIQTTSTGLE